jgi:hypothetical protein
MIDATNCGTAVILIVGGAGAAFAVGKLARLWFQGNAIARKLAEHKARTEWRNAGLPRPTRPAPPMPNVFVPADHGLNDPPPRPKHRHYWKPIPRPVGKIYQYTYNLYVCRTCGRFYNPRSGVIHPALPPRPSAPRPAPPPKRVHE